MCFDTRRNFIRFTNYQSKIIQEWRLESRDALGYNAGFEYHNHQSNFQVSPRPPAAWPVREQRQFRDWEESYRNAVDDGVLPSVFIAGRNQPLRSVLVSGAEKTKKKEKLKCSN